MRARACVGMMCVISSSDSFFRLTRAGTAAISFADPRPARHTRSPGRLAGIVESEQQQAHLLVGGAPLAQHVQQTHRVRGTARVQQQQQRPVWRLCQLNRLNDAKPDTRIAQWQDINRV
jgi:hypothetical protein